MQADTTEGGGSARKTLWRRRWLAWTAGLLLLALAAFATALAVAAHRIEPFLKARIIDGLEQRFRTRVELDQFHVALSGGWGGRWGIWATGRGLRIWPPQHTGGDRPLEIAVQSTPLIQLDEFRFHVPLSSELIKSMRISPMQIPGLRISTVRIKGLRIHVPPPTERDAQTGLESAMQGSPPAALPPGNNSAGALSSLTLERVDCDDTDLVMETEKPDKLPLHFVISHLALTNVKAGDAMGFEAVLTNPKPQGIIHSSGNFGPWNAADPGMSPVNGNYSFDHADLSVFKGIAGTLASTGAYRGTLNALETEGEADVPDFQLQHIGAAMALHTHFNAHVDGTDGDTWLDHVDATLGRSHFTTEGKVVRVKADPARAETAARQTGAGEQKLGGHLIDLKVNVDRGYMEDFLRLATHAPTPLITGAVSLKAALVIPPGKEPVRERIKLDGFFNLDQAHFNSNKISDKVEELSLRGQGKPGALKTVAPDAIASAMHGSFHMAKSVIALPDLDYSVPGADIRLQGTYALDGLLNFKGTARMQATVSQMVGGWKGFLLKPADRLFKKDGAGTLVPIQIRGTREAPEFSLDFARMKTTSPERPGQK